MENLNAKNKLIANILIIISLFVLVLFTKDAYFNLQNNKEQKETLAIQLEDKQKELKKFEEIKNQIENSDNTEVNKYNKDFAENEIIDYLYGLTEADDSGIKVISMNLDAGEINKQGFIEGEINMNLNVDSEENLMTLIGKLNSSEDYKFFIENLDYPFNEDEKFKVTLPLKVYYK
ncbi:MAG: hypothetical protein N4A38_04145 [Candidatus Gracilibacteria bacterium]|nr:hypothetical protein [Candidatus Gracilibacteria bacterium]